MSPGRHRDSAASLLHEAGPLDHLGGSVDQERTRARVNAEHSCGMRRWPSTGGVFALSGGVRGLAFEMDTHPP